MNYELSEDGVKQLLTHKTEAEKRKVVYEAIQQAEKMGFYAGQAMAGVELEDCHQNFKRWNSPVENAGDEL